MKRIFSENTHSDFFGYKNSSASALIKNMAIMIDMPILILDDNDLDTSMGDLKFDVIQYKDDFIVAKVAQHPILFINS